LRRRHFQHGWLTRKKRTDGDVWYYNFREYRANGEVLQRAISVGPVAKYPTEADANQAVELKRLGINREAVDHTPGPLVTMKLLAVHYRQEELSDDVEDVEESKASSTKDAYESYLTNHITPMWGPYHLGEIKTVAVEKWLRGLMKKPVKGKDGKLKPAQRMAKGTKAKIRNIMHAMFEHAIRYEFCERNPITQVRQSGKRERIPEILTVEEFGAILAELKPRERVLVLTDAGAGLRRSELMGLKWLDIDWNEHQANITRSIVHDVGKRERVGKCKTEVSGKPVPLDDFMLDELAAWRELTEYRQKEDWVFASPATAGQWPYWPDTILKRKIIPAARTAGVNKRIGWHTFRHTYATLLKDNGEDVKVVQELLRHATINTTMNVYAQALSPAKRQAQSKVVQMLVKKVAG